SAAVVADPGRWDRHVAGGADRGLLPLGGPALLAQARLDLLEAGGHRGPATVCGHRGARPAVALEARLGGVLLAGDRGLDRGDPGEREPLVVPDADDAVALVDHQRGQRRLVAGVVLLRDPTEHRPDPAPDRT